MQRKKEESSQGKKLLIAVLAITVLGGIAYNLFYDAGHRVGASANEVGN